MSFNFFIFPPIDICGFGNIIILIERSVNIILANLIERSVLMIKSGMREMQKRVTIKDIAELSGVSFQAVSSVLHKTGNSRVSAEKAERVKQIAKELNYRPSHAAKSLSSRRGFTIGVTMPIASCSFYDEMVLHLQRLIKKLGYHSLFSFWGGSDSLSAAEEAIKAIFERNVDGILSWDISPQFRDENIPTVVFGQDNNLYDSVEPDFEYLTREVLEYLTGLGHRKIGFIGIHDDPRYVYLKQQAPEFGVELNPKWSFLSHLTSPEINAMELLLKQCGKDRPTVVFAQSDSVAIQAIKFAAQAGLRIPEDISMISCDNIQIADFYRPSLTTFDINLEGIATAMVEQLLLRMEQPNSEMKSIKIRPRLIIRESCIPNHK